MLCFGSLLSKDYSVVESGMRVFIYRPRLTSPKDMVLKVKILVEYYSVLFVMGLGHLLLIFEEYG